MAITMLQVPVSKRDDKKKRIHWRTKNLLIARFAIQDDEDRIQL